MLETVNNAVVTMKENVSQEPEDADLEKRWCKKKRLIGAAICTAPATIYVLKVELSSPLRRAIHGHAESLRADWRPYLECE